MLKIIKVLFYVKIKQYLYNRRKKKTMMNKENFIKLISHIRNANNNVDKLYELGVDIMDNPIYEAFNRVVSLYLESSFNESGIETIEWWLYEYSDEDKENKVVAMWEADGTEIDVSTVEKLWEYVSEYGLIDNKEG